MAGVGALEMDVAGVSVVLGGVRTVTCGAVGVAAAAADDPCMPTIIAWHSNGMPCLTNRSSFPNSIRTVMFPACTENAAAGGS